MPSLPPVLQSYISGLESHDLDQIAGAVAEELAFITPAQTLRKPQFLEMLRALYLGFPDWHYEHEAPEVRGELVAIKWRQAGTHTASLRLPGFPPVRATGRFVRIPEQFFFYKVERGWIVEIRPDPIPGGAPRGIFEQIGIALP